MRIFTQILHYCIVNAAGHSCFSLRGSNPREQFLTSAQEFFVSKQPIKKFKLIRKSLPWSQRLSFILPWQILRHEPLLSVIFLLQRSAERRVRKASLSFSPVSALRSALHVTNFQMKEDNIKVIPLKLFYYQTFFETWRNEHS